MRPYRATIILAMSSVLAPLNASADGGSGPVFGKLNARDFIELRGLQPRQRADSLRERGLTRDDWLPAFTDATRRYVSMSAAGERPDRELRVRLLLGAMLVELLVEGEAAEPLKQIVAVRQIGGSSITYAALLALDALGSEQAFLLSTLDHPDPGTARFAVLTVGVHDDAATQRQILRVRETRGNDPEVAGALQFINLYHHDVAQYARISTPDERIAFLEQRLSSAYGGFEHLDWYDPYAAGDPLARWAMVRWAELSREDPARMATGIQNVKYHSDAQITAGYRQFLIRLADPVVRQHFPDVAK